MTQLEGLALLVGLCAGICLSGYWLAAFLVSATPAERLATSLLAGLGSMLLMVSWVNLFLPLSLPGALICLAPVLASLLWPSSRRLLTSDLTAFIRDPETKLIGVFLTIYFGVLLWPLLIDPATVFYDGSPNHDSFFWISSSEHLKHHTYLVSPVSSATQPLFATPHAIIGLKPAWGRMGAEGLLALASTLSGTASIKIYLYGTAALYLPWVAAIYLAAKTFFSRKLSIPALIGLALLQPLFIFYYANANLPNLIGILTGAGAVLATEHVLRTSPRTAGGFWAWWTLLLLSLHGLYCAYPEMIPFTGLSCALLWLRAWFARRTPDTRKAALLAVGAVLLSALINPATSIRAIHGFIAVLGLAQTNQNYINIFSHLSLSEYLPALSTLSIPVASRLGDWLGIPLSLALLTGVGLGFWRAQDRFGALAIFAGSIALMIYTLMTGFNYGWQKIVQFSGIFVATMVPVTVLHVLSSVCPDSKQRRWLARACIALVGVFMVYTTAKCGLDVHKWSRRKIISADWFTLRDLSRSSLLNAPVLVEAGTFPMSFFHGMWASYFLPGSHIYFAAYGEQSGGYLRHEVINEGRQSIPTPAAILVGRHWADAFDADLPRLLVGREYALLPHANRVLEMDGVFPLNGLPDAASRSFRFVLKPAVSSELLVTLAPRPNLPPPPPGIWTVRRESGEGDALITTLEGPPPWRIVVPLLSRQRQSLEFIHGDGAGAVGAYPFAVKDIRISSTPASLDPGGASVDFARAETWQDYPSEGLTQDTDGALARHDAASWSFTATSAKADVAVELIAVPRLPGASEPPPLLTELWFNDNLVFTGFFAGPGVLRARILSEHWNQQPRGRFLLRFPDNPDNGPKLLLKTLNIRAETSPRP